MEKFLKRKKAFVNPEEYDDCKQEAALHFLEKGITNPTSQEFFRRTKEIRWNRKRKGFRVGSGETQQKCILINYDFSSEDATMMFSDHNEFQDSLYDNYLRNERIQLILNQLCKYNKGLFRSYLAAHGDLDIMCSKLKISKEKARDRLQMIMHQTRNLKEPICD